MTLFFRILHIIIFLPKTTSLKQFFGGGMTSSHEFELPGLGPGPEVTTD